MEWRVVSWDQKEDDGMAVYLYLNMLPEALIASMLPPQEFGTYLAVGTEKRARGQAKFFAVDRNFASDYFPMSEIESRCVQRADGKPKHSVYLSIYRVLEHVPLEAVGSLYLATRDGRVLEVKQEKTVPEFPQKYFFYQEICPVHPRVVCSLDPKEFTAFMTDSRRSIHVPKILFADLRLGELADNPEKGSVRDLPYSTIEHLRDCLMQLRASPQKSSKTVDRVSPEEIPYRTVQNGFFLGDSSALRYYPMPSEKDLQTRYYEWWRSASM
jgi:hypothetical protein